MTTYELGFGTKRPSALLARPGLSRFYASGRARERVDLVCAAPVKRQHAADGRSYRGHAAALKLASLYHDRVLLEAGILSMQYGPDGGASVMTAPTDRQPARWRTPSGRHRAVQQPFQWAMGREETPGVPAQTMQTIISSETTIAWVATLHPFADELPPGTDWVGFISTGRLPGPVDRLAARWTFAGRGNPALQQAMPVQFMRNAVIEHANHDLAGAASENVAVTIDSVHAPVVAQRFRDYEGWRLRGYVVPILLPQAGDLSWEAIADLRRDKGMARLRAVLREVEEEATAEAAGGATSRLQRTMPTNAAWQTPRAGWEDSEAQPGGRLRDLSSVPPQGSPRLGSQGRQAYLLAQRWAPFQEP